MADEKRILIIDDEPDFIFTLRTRLEHEGFAVLEAADGLAGLELLRREEIDLILLDIMMPRMDGFIFLKTVREEAAAYPVPPIIVVTAYMRTVDETKKALLGDVPVVGKPFEYSELKVLIDRALKR